MVKPPTFDSNGMKKGAWSKEEDERLRAFVVEFGHDNWRQLPLLAGLARCGKSCRLRWVNYLKPGLKREKFTKHEEDLIIKLHNQLGNKWSTIAAKLPGRTDNEIKNYWHAHIKKRGRRGKIIKAPIAEESSSSSSSTSSSSCVTADDHHFQQDSSANIDALSPIADLYSFARAQDDILISDLSQQTCFTQLNTDNLPPFPVEEFHDLELLFQDMQNDASSSSDSGSSFCSLNTAEIEGNFWSESFGEDMFDMDLWS